MNTYTLQISGSISDGRWTTTIAAKDATGAIAQAKDLLSRCRIARGALSASLWLDKQLVAHYALDQTVEFIPIGS